MIKPLLVLLLPILLSSTYPSFANLSSDLIIAETDKLEYYSGETMVISGFVLERKMPEVAISIYDPQDKILVALRANLSVDNSFSKTISLDPSFYTQEGIYTIKINYGKLVYDLDFLIINSGSSSGITSTTISAVPIIPEVIHLQTNKPEYYDNDTIEISGEVSAVDSTSSPTSVLIGIYDTYGNPAGFYFGKIDADLKFQVSFLAKSGINFKKDGIYSINANYAGGNYKIDFKFVTKPSPATPSPATPSPATPSPATPSPATPSPATPIGSIIFENTKSNLQSKSSTNQSSDNYDNLSVEDIELGVQLNQMNLKCDSSKFIDDILYYDGMGPALLRLCNYEEASQFFDKDIIKNPLDVRSLTNKGVVLSKLGYYEDAISFYDSALEFNPVYVPALNDKANALAYLGKTDDAILLWQRVSQIDPNYSISRTNIEKNALDNLVALSSSYAEKPITLSEKSIIEYENNTRISEVEYPEENPILDNLGTVLNVIGTLFGIIHQ